MTARPEDKPAKNDDATRSATPDAATARATDNNASWDADAEPSRHPPVAPNDESPARSLGRSISDALVSAAEENDDPATKRKP